MHPKAMRLLCCQPDHRDTPGLRKLETAGNPGSRRSVGPGRATGQAQPPSRGPICAHGPHQADGPAAPVLPALGLRDALQLGLPRPQSCACRLQTGKPWPRPHGLSDSNLAIAKAAGGKLASTRDQQGARAAQRRGAGTGTRVGRGAHVQHLAGSRGSKALLSPQELRRNSVSQKSSRRGI